MYAEVPLGAIFYVKKFYEEKIIVSVIKHLVILTLRISAEKRKKWKEDYLLLNQ